MKLIFCPSCRDVVTLQKYKRWCQCGKSYGSYAENGLNTVIGGEAIPLGFANLSFVHALRDRPKEGLERRFEAFVIPVKCPTVKHEGG